ncbi:HNH endonuclease signature motif containing protein, partial [Nocardioides sp.]|uniref:HNH endonuclease signature motif containing protein n=1 Tax=Nocardioides sp. TaxID=35761 RepID=UPI003517542D
AVVAGRLAPWRAARIADHTAALNAEAAGFVDQRLGSAVATGVVGWKRLGQLVDEAVMRFDPDLSEARRLRAAEARVVRTQSCGEGLAAVEAVLDAADAADLERAVSRQAEALARSGDTSPIAVRRARALGVIARIALGQEVLIADPTTGEVVSSDPGRRVTLNVHLTPESLAVGVEGGNPVARWEEGRVPVLIGQVREWLLQPGTTIRVQPVIDLAAHHPVEAYEIPDRIRRQVELRDHGCRFPSCEQAAARCDLDHRVSHAAGGVTCACNLQPLCRRHHRAKTHAGWRVDLIADQPGHYRWVSPHGYRFDVHPEGTTDDGGRR